MWVVDDEFSKGWGRSQTASLWEREEWFLQEEALTSQMKGWGLEGRSIFGFPSSPVKFWTRSCFNHVYWLGMQCLFGLTSCLTMVEGGIFGSVFGWIKNPLMLFRDYLSDDLDTKLVDVTLYGGESHGDRKVTGPERNGCQGPQGRTHGGWRVETVMAVSTRGGGISTAGCGHPEPAWKRASEVTVRT